MVSPVVNGDDSEDWNDLDLDLFTNSTFLDVDFGADAGGVKERKGAGEPGGMSVLDTVFTDFDSFTNLPPLPAVHTSFAEAIGNITTAPVNDTIAQPPPPVLPPSQATSPVSVTSSSAPAPKTRKRASSSATVSTAADEDKRRRNTAASARFRVKKKQREQELKDATKEMTEKVQKLEERVKQLEMENTWLKNLVVEKKGSEEEPVVGDGN